MQRRCHRSQGFSGCANGTEAEKKAGFIAVSMGEGLGEIFTGLGVDHLIEEADHEPSTEDMLNAINEVNADTIFILPNNSNIILVQNRQSILPRIKISLLFLQRMFLRELRL